MGKKKHRGTYTSKGQRPNVSKSTMRLMRKNETEKAIDVLAAWRAGKNPWVSNIKQNGMTVKVRANTYWGNIKKMNSGQSGREE